MSDWAFGLIVGSVPDEGEFPHRELIPNSEDVEYGVYSIHDTRHEAIGVERKLLSRDNWDWSWIEYVPPESEVEEE